MKILMAVMSALWLAGCASFGGALVPGTSSKADARATLGEPVAVHAGVPGQAAAESWEYPTGPAGRYTYMARFDAQGKLLGMDQVLTVNQAAKIAFGKATESDERMLLGRPGYVYRYDNGTRMWDYAAVSGDGVPRKIRLTVTFDKAGVALSGGESFDPEEFLTFDGASSM